MRFLLMGDRHNSQNKPENRIDVDFLETLKNKDEEIMKIAKDNKVSAILQAGDFWTDGDARIKNDFLSEVVNRWFNKDDIKDRLPIIGIAGNHDLIGNNINSLPNTTAGLLNALGYMPLVSKDNPYIFKMENGKTVAITGTNYHINMDKPAHINDYIVDKKLGDYHIHIVHGMLSPKGLGTLIRHTTIDQIKHTKADITFCGHDHIGFPTMEHDNKYFVNPGAIVRLKNDLKEMTREVKVIIVDISDTGITLKEVPLATAIDGKLVLSRDIIERKKEKQHATEMMKSQIKQLEITQKVRFDDILEETYTDKNIDKSIIEDLSKRLNEKKVDMAPTAMAPVDTWITDIELHNFQSHASTQIEFSKKLNVILGESRQGKTAVLRALRWLLENKPSGKSMIRNGENYCYVKIKLANGTVIVREIGDKINGYKIIFPNGDVEEGNTKLVGTVQDLCGFNNMTIDGKLSMPINFMTQGSGWYLIGDNITSTDRARILGAIQNTNSADAVVKDLEKENTQHATIIKNNSKQIDITLDEMQKVMKEKETLEKIKYILEKKLLVEKIKEYMEFKKDFEEKSKTVEEINKRFDEVKITNCLNKIEYLSRSLAEIETQSKVHKTEQQNILVVNERLKKLNIIEEVEEKIIKLKEKANAYEVIFENAVIHAKEKSKQKKIDAMMAKLSMVKDLTDVEYVRTLINKKEEITQSMIIYTKSQKIIKEADKFISSAGIVDKFETIKSNILQHLVTIENSKQHLKEYEASKADVLTQTKLIKEKEEEISKLIEAKGKLLKEAKICPTCMGTITDDIVENLINKEEH